MALVIATLAPRNSGIVWRDRMSVIAATLNVSLRGTSSRAYITFQTILASWTPCFFCFPDRNTCYNNGFCRQEDPRGDKQQMAQFTSKSTSSNIIACAGRYVCCRQLHGGHQTARGLLILIEVSLLCGVGSFVV